MNQERLNEISKIPEVKIDLESIKKNVGAYTSDKLCEMVACDRYFGCYREVAVVCMEELARRRANGDTLDFEARIKELLAPLPKLDFKLANIKDVLGQLSTKGKK